MREIRATLSKCLENGRDPKRPAYPGPRDLPRARRRAGALLRLVRHGQPRPAARGPHRPRSRTCCRTASSKKLFYLSIDFLRDKPITPKQEAYQETIAEAYPHVTRARRSTARENPNLMPKGSITVRFHSVGGWGAITTGKNLAMTLFDLLGYHIKANPKYGSEKKGQPTTYYLSAAPEPIRINCEYFYVDVVLSPDPNVFHHTNALAGLKEGGVFILQSDQPTPEQVWQDIPALFQKIIVDKKIKRLLPRRLQDRARGGERPRAAAAHAGHRLPGRLLRRLAGHGAGRARRGDAAQGDRATSCSTSSAPRARASSRTTCASCSAASTSCSEVAARCRSRRRSPASRVAGGEPTIPVMVRRRCRRARRRSPTSTASGSRPAASTPAAWATTPSPTRSSGSA